jgi:arylsulfatase A-like enzyme
VSDKPPWIADRPVLDAAAQGAIDRRWRSQARSLAAVDDAVAGIVRELRATGELANTMIVMTSDNGFFHGQHRIAAGKFLPYEPSIRSPLLISGPLIATGLRGGRIDQPTANIDVAPTILDAARVAPLREVDGVSLRPLLAGDVGTDWSGRAVYLVGVAGRGCAFCGKAYQGVRRSDGLVYWRFEATGDMELYDLNTDPDQLDDLSADPAHAVVLAEMEAARVALMSCAGASCGQPGNWTPWAPPLPAPG